jgi:hypothetical protein
VLGKFILLLSLFENFKFSDYLCLVVNEPK